MTKLNDTVDDRNHPRTMAVATRETVRTDEDGTVEVDDDEHVMTLKRAGFEVVGDDPTEGEDDAEADEDDDTAEDAGETLAETDVDPDEIVDEINENLAEQIDAGECPWCDDYEGEHVGRHASSAHPEKWDSFKEAE